MPGAVKKEGKSKKALAALEKASTASSAAETPSEQQPSEGERARKKADKGSESDSPLKPSDRGGGPPHKTPKGGPKSGRKGGGPRGGPGAVDSFESKQHLPPNVVVAVGDKIKVFYQRDEIYGAKVITVKDPEQGEDWPKFRVHYLGWNSRYDEWIPRSRYYIHCRYFVLSFC